MFAGGVSTYEGEIDFEDGSQYGAILDYTVQPGTQVELMFATMQSRATAGGTYYGGPIADLDEKFQVTYIQVGGLHQIQKGKVAPFGMFGAGVAIFAPENDRFETAVRFAMSGALGMKIYLSESIGLRVQGRLFIPVYFTGGSVWVGTGGGGAAVSGGIPVVQGDLGGSIFIRL
jgi:hypothetical protein